MSRDPAPVQCRDTAPVPEPNGSFAAVVRDAADTGELVVQPRMGFSAPERMRAGLSATRDADAATVGTITLDSYTRVGDFAALRRADADGTDLNGYPLVTADKTVTTTMLDDVRTARFPVQVRHGSARPGPIVDTLIELGIDATEGGPVSYCLPYGRVPLRESVGAWASATARFATVGPRAHVETFGGCMLGQLCPPALLIAVSVLEGMFFAQHGIRSVSLSLTQQTSMHQDLEALHALRAIADRHLTGLDRHIVVYAYMGVYPRSASGAVTLLTDSARLAVLGGAERLIVKTAAEAFRIPTIEENVIALEQAAATARHDVPDGEAVPDTGIRADADTLIEAVLALDDDIGAALVKAFELGLLDVPYCLHTDNAGRTRSYVDESGRVCWSDVGSLPVRPGADLRPRHVGSAELLGALNHVRHRYDAAEPEETYDLPAGTAAPRSRPA
ncbi:methylaspartate mutase [Prauserella halophila]|uniref:Methylaspartate mutase n=1 Tax=Prauserella halophila TaxID=185641 RepID=A0ABN1W393_9PSEU|nr:methylaspartate mutase [Prauserella halophila]MCP2235323.1 Glutamate mutase subunit E [Prauserella halophila]